MAKLHKGIKKIMPDQKLQQKIFGKKNYDKVHFIGSSLEKSYDAAKDAERAKTEAENAPVMPIADEEELLRAKKKSLSRRNRGRSSTILASDSETLG